MSSKPVPPRCVVCDRVIDQSTPKVKGPYCSLACREADYRAAVTAHLARARERNER